MQSKRQYHRLILTIIFLLIRTVVVHAQNGYLIKVGLSSLKRHDQYIQMYYWLDDLSDLEKPSNDSCQFYEFLKSFELPVFETDVDYDKCSSVDTLDRWTFKRIYRFRFSREKLVGDCKMKYKIVSINADTCKEILHTKVWGSYNFHYRYAITITKIHKVKSLNFKERKFVRRFNNSR